MEETARSLERKLNELIDTEIAKGTEADVPLILACCDALLRLDDLSRYTMPAQRYFNNLRQLAEAPERAQRKHKAIKTALIAAAVAALLALAALGYAQVKYDIFHLSDHSVVRFPSHNAEAVETLTVGYVPEGFLLIETNDETDHDGVQWHETYENGELFFSIYKEPIRETNNINTEYDDSKTINQNGIEYIVFGENTHGRGILWVNNNYEYNLAGNLSDDELLKIAFSIR